MGFYMRLGNYRWLFAFLVLFSSFNVFAVDYYWQYPDGGRNQRFPNPEAACRQVAADQPRQEYLRVERATSTRYGCFIRIFNANGTVAFPSFKPSDISRAGTTCTPPTVFDPATDSCKAPEPDKCEALAGSSRPFAKSGQAPDSYASISGGRLNTVQSACFDTCVANTSDQKCTARTTGNYVCRGTAYFTGAQCGTSDSATVDETEETTRPDPQDIKEQEPCNYTTAPDGSQVCKSVTNNEKEGQSCGSFNGVQLCVDKNPTQNKVEIDTKVESETTADGKTKITKTDTAKITKCKGINDCKTETTTNKTVTVKNGNGDTESTTGTCTGAACPDNNGNPDANGDGLGDCSTGDCGEGEGDEEGGGGWYEGTDDTFGSVLQAFADDVAQIPMVDGIGNFLTFSPGGSCPAGYVNAWVFTIELDQWCGDHIPWSLIAAVVMAAAAFLSYRIAFT